MKRIDKIAEYDALTGQCNRHPLITVIGASGVGPTVGCPVSGPFYALFFQRSHREDRRYGCGCCDFRVGTLVFKHPGQMIDIDRNRIPGHLNNVGILFHAAFFGDETLAVKKESYGFFFYDENESLHLSEREMNLIEKCIGEIEWELQGDVDRYSFRLLASRVGLLLDYCLRFYERQFVLRSHRNRSVVARVDRLLDEYFDSECNLKSERKAAEYVSARIPLSVAYLNDLMRMETGRDGREYIRLKYVDAIGRRLVGSKATPTEIAAEFGFATTHAFCTLFRQVTGYSPEQYRIERRHIC